MFLLLVLFYFVKLFMGAGVFFGAPNRRAAFFERAGENRGAGNAVGYRKHTYLVSWLAKNSLTICLPTEYTKREDRASLGE